MSAAADMPAPSAAKADELVPEPSIGGGCARVRLSEGDSRRPQRWGEQLICSACICIGLSSSRPRFPMTRDMTNGSSRDLTAPGSSSGTAGGVGSLTWAGEAKIGCSSVLPAGVSYKWRMADVVAKGGIGSLRAPC
eukprot:5792743-Prymnesium_polylepis.1